MNSNERTQVALRVFVRIIKAWKTALWIILDRSNVLKISWILAFAWHPNRVQLEKKEIFLLKLLKLRFLTTLRMSNFSTYRKLVRDSCAVDKLFQISRHIVRQMFCVIVEMWTPSKDLVELKENARRTTVVVVKVFLNARSPCLDVYVTNLSFWRLLAIAAVVNVLTTSRNRTRRLVSCEVINRHELGRDSQKGTTNNSYVH